MGAKIHQLYNDVSFLKRIRQLALDSENVVLTTHARKRMVARRITLLQVLNCLRKGTLCEPVHLTAKGDWKATIELIVAGDAVRVAAALAKGQNGELIIVLTVMH